MKTAILIAVFCIPIHLFAQPKAYPAFGKVTAEDLDMKACNFDKDADAMVLFTEGESFFKIVETSAISPVYEQMSYHSRVKIFNKGGFGMADIKIRYPNSTEVEIKNFSAQTYNLDASGNVVVTKVEKAAIYDKKINSRYSERVFVFPDIKAGSIIEYKYRIIGSTDVSWRFQREVPVASSRFIMDFPRELIMQVTPFHNLPVKKWVDDHSLRNYTTYTMENIPALEKENYMTNRQDYLQRMEARLVALDFPDRPRKDISYTWPKVIKAMLDDENFGKQLKKNIPRTAELDKQLAGITQPYEKMLVIHKYVKDNMQWDERESLWALNGVKSAWKDKTGTSGEINLILINLLKDADMDAAPLLVSTRENGRVNTMMPGIDQFNKVLAYVTIGEKNFILDAVDKNTPSNLIPLDIIVSEGLLLKKPDSYDWGWVMIWDDKAIKKNDVFVNGEITPDGKFQGIATMTSYAYKKLELQDKLKAGKPEMIDYLAASSLVVIDSLEYRGHDDDMKPLVQSFKFSAPTFSSGDYHYFSVNYFSGFDKNPFIADERKTDIFFGPNQEYKFSDIIFLPEGYTINELPKNVKLMMPDSSIIFKRISSYNNDMLSVGISLEFKKPLYQREEYPLLQEFYKKLFAMMDEKFVYVKKP